MSLYNHTVFDFLFSVLIQLLVVLNKIIIFYVHCTNYDCENFWRDNIFLLLTIVKGNALFMNLLLMNCVPDHCTTICEIFVFKKFGILD